MSKHQQNIQAIKL